MLKVTVTLKKNRQDRPWHSHAVIFAMFIAWISIQRCYLHTHLMTIVSRTLRKVSSFWHKNFLVLHVSFTLWNSRLRGSDLSSLFFGCRKSLRLSFSEIFLLAMFIGLLQERNEYAFRQSESSSMGTIAFYRKII